MRHIFGFDCYSSEDIAERVENVGVAKTRLPLIAMSALGILAGGFIGLGAMCFNLVVSDASLSFAIARIFGGIVFSLGLILVVLAGAELFTGNNLLVMAWVSKRISAQRFVRSLVVVYLANLAGALGLAIIVALSGYGQMNCGAVGRTAVALATVKCALPFGEAFVKGVLCNLLVCLAIWIAMAGRTVTDKVLAIVFPVMAFVACGFEHSIANMYFIPLGIFLQGAAPFEAITGTATLNWAGFAKNLLPVTLGNLVGGAGMVGLVYWVIYRRGTQAGPAPETGSKQA